MLLVKEKIRLNLNKCCRVVFAAVLAVLLAAAVELIWNYPVFLGGSRQVDLTPYLMEHEDGLTCKYKFPKDTYIGKLHLKGTFSRDANYTLKLTVVNGFGARKTVKLKDKVYMAFPEAYTNVGETVRSLSFLLKDAKSGEIGQITAVSQFCFNTYRFLFAAVLLFLIALVFLLPDLLTKKLEWLFAASALGFGMLIILMSGPSSRTWDEQIHFQNVYQLSSGKTVEWNAAAWYNYKNTLPEADTKEELYMLKQYQNGNARIFFHTSENTSDISKLSMRAYFPMALFFRLGRMLGLSWSNVYMLGRMGNLFFFTLILWIAIHVARGRKILIFSLALLPTVLFQGSMYTYDGMVFALLTLGVVLLLNEFMVKDSVNALQMTAAVALISMGCFAKAIYAPVLLLALALPHSKFADRRQACLFKGCVCMVFLLMMSTFVLPVLSGSTETNLAYSDTRGGDTDVLAQLASLVRHPIPAVKLFLSNIFSFDNFRNLGYEAADSHLMTNLMFLNFSSLGTLEDKWSLLLIPFLLLLFFVPDEEVRAYTRAVRFWFGAVVLAAVMLIWLAMYLSFTEVGRDMVAGVQARYYLPLLLPLSCMTGTGRITVRAGKRTYNGIIAAVNGVLISAGIYHLLLAGCL